MRKLTRIYGFLNGMMPDGGYIVTAATEHGETLCSVVVRTEEEGRRALGMDGKHENRHHIYEKHYPEGATLEWVPFHLTGTHTGIKRMVQEHYERKISNE